MGVMEIILNPWPSRCNSIGQWTPITANTLEAFLTNQGIPHALSALSMWLPMAKLNGWSGQEALAQVGPGNWQANINKCLLAQYITPSVTTNCRPAELLMGCKLRSQLDRLQPNYNAEAPSDSTSQLRVFAMGDIVYAWSYTGGTTWVPAKIIDVTGPRSYR